MTISVLAAVALAVVASSSAFLFVYGANVLYLSWRALRLPAPSPAAPAPAPCGERVVVQLPIYDERYVAERVIDAAARLDWPRDRLEIQVLDDSDDDTPEIVARAVARWRRAGVRVDHVRRGGRAGYKAGALAHGLTLTSAPLVAVFDADFVPAPDFLRRMVPSLGDPSVAFAQARWGHLNEGFSLFTYLQSLMTDFHFLVEQAVRPARGHLTSFTGSAGIWRRAAIDDAGGWDASTLTEDLDLSYRAQLRGWRAVYREDVVVPQELPVSVNAYRGQQARWATGSFQCAARLLGPVLRSRLRPAVKLQAALHLLGYAAPVAMLAQIACYPVLLLAQASGRPLRGPAILVVASLLSLAPAAGMAVAQARRGREWWRHWLGLAGWSVLGAGTAPTVAASLWRALRGGGEFERTPKFRIEALGEAWRGKAYFKPGDRRVPAELALGAAGFALAVASARQSLGVLALYAGLFGSGFLYVAGLTLVQSLRQVRYEALAPAARALLPSLHAPALVAFVGVLLVVTAQLPDPFEDSYQHWLVAANLATTGRLQDPLFQMQDTWLPAYHVLAAAVLKLLGTWQLGALRLVDVALGMATLALTYRLAGDRRRGLVAAALLALNPVFLLTASSAVAEPLLVLLLLGAVAAAVARRPAPAATLACLACLTGTKAWLWLGCVAAVVVVEAALRARRPAGARRLAWVAPALALALTLQVVFGFASHSVARAAQEVASAGARGSLPSTPLGRAGEFLGYFGLASLPLVALAPAGLVLALRARDRSPLLRLLCLPSALYLGLVAGLVLLGVYSGSHRYYYPALPGLALLAAFAVDRVRMPLALVPAGVAAAVVAVYVPVLTGLSADNRGLQAAGSAAAYLPGTLLTDSPAAAYWSHKPPADVHGSRELPDGRQAALDWMRSRDVGGLVLESVDYYRASRVLPDLVAGREASPFVRVGDASTYTVPGGKPVRVYALGGLALPVAGGLALSADLGTWPAHGKTAPLGKGPVLAGPGGDLAGDGLGFGVPLARFPDGWWFPGPDSTLAVGPDGRSFVRTYRLDRREVDDAAGRFQRFEAGPVHGTVQVTYRVRAGAVAVEVRPLGLDAGLLQAVIANEESAAFDDYADASVTRRGAAIGSASPVAGDWARLRSASLGVEWEVPAPPRPARFLAERELRPSGIDFSGLEWAFDSGLDRIDYTVFIRRAR